MIPSKVHNWTDDKCFYVTVLSITGETLNLAGPLKEESTAIEQSKNISVLAILQGTLLINISVIEKKTVMQEDYGTTD